MKKANPTTATVARYIRTRKNAIPLTSTPIKTGKCFNAYRRTLLLFSYTSTVYNVHYTLTELKLHIAVAPFMNAA